MNKHKVLLALFAVYLLVYFAYVIRGVILGDRFALLILLVGVLVLILAGCAGIKKSFLVATRPHLRRPAQPEEFPTLDETALAQLTEQWQELGFVFTSDSAAGALGSRMGAVFSRVLEHPGEGALVEMSQQFAPLKTLPFSTSITSAWGEREAMLQSARALQPESAPLAAPSGNVNNDKGSIQEPPLWVFVTHNRAPNKFWPLMRQKRLMSERLAPASSPQELWQAHQERRALLESRLKEPHLTGELVPLLDAHGLVLNARLWRGLKRTPAWKFGMAVVSRAPIPAQYDGDLPA